jgi:hypothetical protein
MKQLVLAIAAIALLVPATTQAALITVAPAGTTTVLTTLTGTWSSAPSVTAGGYSVFAPAGNDVWYGDSAFGLSGNGSWGDFAWVGGLCWSGACTATIDLGGLYSAVGGFMNYATSYGGAYIRALATDMTVLEAYDLYTSAPISTPGGFNDGAFRGISRGSADIRYFQIADSFLIMHDLTVSGAAVPDTGSSLLLLGLGLAGIRALRRR